MPSRQPNGPVAPRAAHNTAVLPTSIRRATHTRSVSGQMALPITLPGLDDTTARKRRTAHASLFPPSTTRARWLLTFGCPACGTWHHGYADSRESAGGPRTAPCGRIVTIKIARAYGDQPPADRGRAR